METSGISRRCAICRSENHCIFALRKSGIFFLVSRSFPDDFKAFLASIIWVIFERKNISIPVISFISSMLIHCSNASTMTKILLGVGRLDDKLDFLSSVATLVFL